MGFVSFCMTIGFCIVHIIDILTLILGWKCHIDLPQTIFNFFVA
jgi:hypothetical protein